MKNFLFSFIYFLSLSVYCQEILIDIRGYYKNDEIVMNNGDKLVQYNSKGNWNDNINNYGRFSK